MLYTSEQTHSDIVQGKKQIKTKRVTIRGKSGYKSVTIQINGRKKTSKRKLTKKEIDCIRRCQFIPGLFKDCESCVR
jgi:DNA-binding protein YbaB